MKTRLDEFPLVSLSEDYLLLVQSPVSYHWGAASLNSVKNWIQKTIDHNGISLAAVWASLSKTVPDTYANELISEDHIPVLPQSKVDGLAESLSALKTLIGGKADSSQLADYVLKSTYDSGMSGKLDKSVFDKLFTVHYKEGSATEIESLELNYGTWTTGFLSVRGLDDTTGSGSGGTDLPAVWESLTKNEMPYQDVTINLAHIPTLPQSKVTGLEAALSSLRSSYAGISALIPQAATADNQLADKAFVNSSIATATATFRGTFETLEALKAAEADKNDYAFWEHKDADGNTCYDKYTYDGSAWKFEYRLNNSSFTAAQWGAINSGITDTLVTKLSGIATGAQVNVIETVKLGGTALAVSGKAVDITGTGIKSVLGISDWALAASKPSYTTAEVTEKTNLYYTDARVKAYADTLYLGKSATAAAATKLANSRKLWGNAFNGTADVSGDITLGSGKRIYFGSTSYYIELVNGNIHTNVGLYSDKFISARGVDPNAGGGSGASLPVVWASLQGNTDDYKNETIHPAHIPTLPVSRIDGLATALAGKQPLITADSKLDYSLLKNTPTIGNGTITIKQGTNSQTFSTNQGDNKTITLTDTTYESKTAASGGTALSLVTTGEKYTWNNKQPLISDLDTIRSNAANGAAAYGWGDHSKAGYITLTNNTGQIYTNTVIDASTLDADTWYPVLLRLSPYGPLFHIEVTNALDTNVPSWSTHQNGFTCKKVWEIYGSGWGAIPPSMLRRIIYQSLYAYCDVDPVRGIGQLTNSSNDVVFVRGGGKYRFACSRGVVPTLITTSTVSSGQTIAPTTTAPDEIVGNNQLTTDSIAWDRLTGKPTTLSGYGITDALPLTGGTISGWLIINASTLPISELTTDGITNNTWNSAQNVNLLLRSANNAMTISLGGQENERKGIIQVGHSASSFAKVLGDLYLNKFGGKVYIGEKLAYHEGNANKSDVDWNAANLTAEKRLRIKNANVIAFLSTDAMPKERLLGPMSSYNYDLAWHNGAQWNKVYHSGNFIDGTNYISPKTTLEGYGIEDWIVRNTGASPDTFTTSGNYRVSTVGTSGVGYNFNYGQVLVLRGPTNSDTIAQIAVPYSGSNLYFRSGTVSNFTDAAHPWWTIFTSGNCNLPTIPWKCSSLTANDSVEAKANLYGQSLKFLNIGSSAGHGGYIDFHFNGSTENYTSRIIEDAKGQVSLYVATVRIGKSNSANLLFLRPSYNYIWTDTAGGTLVLGTIDGGVTSSNNSALFIKGKKVYIGGTEAGNNALNVLGVAHATTGIYSDGYVSARGQDTSSDIRLKTDFRPLDGALEYIRGTHFTRFRWKDGSGESVGIIAQEEQSREYGFLVRSHGEIGHLTYDYAASTALLGAALQEEDDKVEALKRRVKKLENELNRLKQSNYAN